MLNGRLGRKWVRTMRGDRKLPWSFFGSKKACQEASLEPYHDRATEMLETNKGTP